MHMCIVTDNSVKFAQLYKHEASVQCLTMQVNVSEITEALFLLNVILKE